MPATHLLVIIGLALTVAGSVAAASQLLAGEPLLDPLIQASRRDTLERSREARKRGYPVPPYSEARRAAKVAEADRLFAEESEALTREIASAFYRDTARRQKATLLGLGAIAAGSALQGWAALLT